MLTALARESWPEFLSLNSVRNIQTETVGTINQQSLTHTS